MTDQEKTHYEALGLTADADQAEVKKAARKLLQQHHPDRGGDEATAARINEAYAILRNETTRAEYDDYLLGGSSEAPVPDPDAYADEWGEEDQWEHPVDEEILDIEVEDDAPGAPAPPTPASSSPSATDPGRPTKVRTVMGKVAKFGLLPAVVPLAIIMVECLILGAPAVFAGLGILLACLVVFVVRKRLPAYKGQTAIIAASMTSIVLVAALAFKVQGEMAVLMIAAQATVATAILAWILMSGISAHRTAQRIITAKGLKPDGTIFGPSTGDAAGELLNATIWRCLNDPGLQAARGFQTSDGTNPFTKAVILGNRVALIRPLLLDTHGLQGNSLYWSPPTLFLDGSSIPTPVLRLDLAHFHKHVRQVMPGAVVQEFVVVYPSTLTAAVGTPSTPPPGLPGVIAHANAEAALKDFLLAEKPITHIDHRRAAEAVMGLEYNLLNS